MTKKKSKIKSALKSISLIFLLCAVSGIIFFFSYIFTLEDWRKIDLSVIPEQKLQLEIFDNKENAIITLSSDEKRSSIDLSCLSESTINAFLAAEDLRFFEHNGIDMIRIFGALAADIKSGGIKEGASTITQQVIKNLYLTDSRTIERKIQEALIAMKFEKMYSKEEILEIYLNTVYFGEGAYGLQQASLSYFGIPASDLSISQAAMLAGLLKAP